MQVALAGHSFISRLEEFMWRNTPPPAVPNPFPVSGHYVRFLGRRGAHLSGPRAKAFHKAFTLDTIGLGKLDLVYISMGTNDLDSGKPPQLVAQHVVSIANYAVHGLGAKQVIIEQIIPRCPIKFPGFRPLAIETNRLIQERLATGDYPCIKYWKLQGFWNPPEPVLATDGVHFNTAGLHKYWDQVRGAIVWAQNHSQSHGE